MANDFGKVATVLAQMATHAQILEVILIKAMIKCIERDGIIKLPLVEVKM